MFKQRKDIKIVISDTACLFPPLWGGPKRIWNIFANFSQDLFDITYVGIDHTLSSNGKKYSFNRIRNNFKEILCAFPPHYYLWHMIEKKIIKTCSLDLFAYLYMHTDWHFRYILNSQKADVLICSHPWSSLSMRKNSRQLFIYDAHNCEYLLMEQILGKCLFRKFVLKKTRKIEADACKKSDLILVCSEKEKRDFIDIYKVGAQKIVIIPNGANSREKITPRLKECSRQKLSIGLNEKVVIFIGAYYKPNIDAVKYIIETIAPALKEFKFLIVGTVANAFKTEQKHFNVNFLGRVSDEQLDTVLSVSDIAINPMFNGSGINIKMLDYMSYGLPIVTTECGARGIEANGKLPMIVSSVDKFIDNIRMLNVNYALYKEISESGRTLIAERYDWRAISSKLQQIILEKVK
jgi:glycosyltransferase involved in cell wall biosynthesis